MAEVTLSVGGRRYRLACRDGEEAALAAAGRAVDARASELAQALGAVPETRLLLMTALSIAGEQLAPAAKNRAPDAALLQLVEKMEALADLLEQSAAS